jgi:hypothetical protein
MRAGQYLASMKYSARARWRADDLDPQGIATRISELAQRVAHLAPTGERWFVADRRREKYADVNGADLVQIVEGNEYPGDFGATNTGCYSVMLFTLASAKGPPSNQSLGLVMTVGPTPFGSMHFEIGDIAKPPDYSQLGYQTYRDMIGAVAEVWPCPWILATNYRKRPPPVDASVNGPAAPPFGGAWIVYLSAPLAKDLAPPAELVAEPTAGGGVILSATQTLLDQSSADDMRRSQLLEAIARERIGEDPGRLPASKPARVGPA